MRLDAHAQARSHRREPCAGSGRGPAGLPPFFAGMTQAARSALGQALSEAGGLVLVAGPPESGRAATLRGLLRARPDALAVGDIGGDEKAAATLQAARGRLVLATCDSGDALAALSDLAASGVDPFAIASVLRLVLAQRQVRRLCPSCRAPEQAPGSVTAPLGLEPGSAIQRPQGCANCEGTGFTGPIGVFETLPVDATVGRLIAGGSDQAAIANHVFRKWPNFAAAVRTLVAQGFAAPEDGIALLRPPRR